MKKQMLRIIHIDDDPGFLKRFKTMLEAIDDVPMDYLGGFDSPEKALRFLKKNPVDLIFLDIEMPGQDGLSFAAEVKDLKIDIIFVTAHSGYALQAFELCALNFLVKPPDPQKLAELLKIATERNHPGTAESKDQIESFYKFLEPAVQKPDKIFINQVGTICVIKLDEIMFLNAKNSYTIVVKNNNDRLTTSKAIRVFEEALHHNRSFLRVSRSFIINKEYVKSIQRNGKTRQISLTMDNGEQIETSFKTKDEAMEVLSE